MRIPADKVPGCPQCKDRDHVYDLACRGCFIRKLAHLSRAAQQERFAAIATKTDQATANQIMLEVANHYRANKSWGTFA